MPKSKSEPMKTTDFPKMQKMVATKPKRKLAKRKKTGKK